MKIAQVEALRIRQPEFAQFEWWCTSPLDGLYDSGGVGRASGAALFNMPLDLRRDPVFHVLVRVTTDDGLSGLGAIGLGSRAAAEAVEGILAPLVLGRNPFDVEALWELMYRSTLNIGRKGLILEAISGIDVAIWDVLGKVVGQPVYNLLGGGRAIGFGRTRAACTRMKTSIVSPRRPAAMWRRASRPSRCGSATDQGTAAPACARTRNWSGP